MTPNSSAGKNEPAAVPSPAKIILGFAAIYLIWGTTYLAIRYSIETFPPFLMGSLRFLAAGSILYAVTRLRGAAPPERGHWKAAFVIGAFLMVGGQSGVAWAEERIPSGMAAVLIATVPLWILVLGLLGRSRRRPEPAVLGGLLLGFAGVTLLIAPWQGVRDLDALGVLAVLGAAASWASGSLYSLRARLPESRALATSMEMLAGGLLLVVVASLRGEWSELAGREVTLLSVGALIYLIVPGSLVALTAYMWLLTVAPPSRVATYTYVNPVVAVFLGWAVASEPLNLRMVVATAIILAAVFLVTVGRALARAPQRASHPTTAVPPGTVVLPAAAARASEDS